MTPGWRWLLLAGVAEAVWSQTIKPTQGFTRLLPTLVCFVVGAAAVWLLTRSVQTIPVGTAYAVFTGLGAVAAVTLGVLRIEYALGAARLVALSLIISGVVLCHLADN